MDDSRKPRSDNDNEALAIMRDLDAQDPGAGKDWSVALARKLGWGEAEIEKYLLGGKI